MQWQTQTVHWLFRGDKTQVKRGLFYIGSKGRRLGAESQNVLGMKFWVPTKWLLGSMEQISPRLNLSKEKRIRSALKVLFDLCKNTGSRKTKIFFLLFFLISRQWIPMDEIAIQQDMELNNKIRILEIVVRGHGTNWWMGLYQVGSYAFGWAAVFGVPGSIFLFGNLNLRWEGKKSC